MQPTSRSTRHSISLIVSIPKGGEIWGMTRNLSATGMLLDAAWLPPAGSELDVVLRWCTHAYMCRVRVVRHERNGVGVAYLDPSADFAAAVDCIARCGTPHPPNDAANEPALLDSVR